MKAALALSGMTVAELAATVPPHYRLSVRTIDRTIQGSRTPHDWEIELFARELGVPEWFLRDGLGGRAASPTAYDATELRDELARRHDELLARLDDQAEMLRAIMASLDGARSRNG